MRHRVDHRKLGRTAAHRKAMLANMVMSLFEKERITTTDAKAKEARRSAERLITRAKKGYTAYQEGETLASQGKETEARQMKAVALAHWRQAGKVVRKTAVLKKLFGEIAPKYLERPGGYTRILHLGHRPGDNARTVLLELVGDEAIVEDAPQKKGGKRAAAKADVAKKKPSKKHEAHEEAKAEMKAAEVEDVEAKAEDMAAEEAEAPKDGEIEEREEGK